MPSWTVTATGDYRDDDPAAGRALADALTAVLINPRFGTTASHMDADAHRGPVHLPPAPAGHDSAPPGRGQPAGRLEARGEPQRADSSARE